MRPRCRSEASAFGDRKSGRAGPGAYLAGRRLGACRGCVVHRDFSRGSAPNNFAGNEDLARAVVALLTATAGHAAAVKPVAQQPLHHNESAPS